MDAAQPTNGQLLVYIPQFREVLQVLKAIVDKIEVCQSPLQMSYVLPSMVC